MSSVLVSLTLSVDVNAHELVVKSKVIALECVNYVKENFKCTVKCHSK